jgi:hypothetical protein
MGIPLPTNLLAGLLAFYELSDLTDSTGNGYDLTNSGTINFQGGRIDKGAQIVSAPSAMSLYSAVDTTSAPYTISAWIKITSYDPAKDYKSPHLFLTKCFMVIPFSLGASTAIGTFAGYNGINYNGQGTGPGKDVFPWTLSKWHHIVVRCNTDSFDLFMDGALRAHIPSTPQPVYGTENMLIGGRSVVGDAEVENLYFDSIGFWNRALSDVEVTEIYSFQNSIPMQIFVQKLSVPAEESYFNVQPDDSVLSVKQKLSIEELPEVYDITRIKLQYNSSELSNELPISYYDIQNESHVASSYIDPFNFCNPVYDKFAKGDECGEKRFLRLRLLGYV